MSIFYLVLFVAGLGGIGGLANCLVSGELSLPHIDRNTKTWRPGWVGNVIVGAVAAVVVWGIYGPFSSFDIIKSDFTQVSITIAQLLSSLVIGFSGGRILTSISEKGAEKITKENLAKAFHNLLNKWENI
jgi:hypothetical protein